MAFAFMKHTGMLRIGVLSVKSLSRTRARVFPRVGSMIRIASVGIGLLLVMMTGCSRDHYKEDADHEVYNIIESKWQDDFGLLANYKIQDTAPNEVVINTLIPPSRSLKLVDAVQIATQISRDYQSQKESLYLSALNLTGTRHQYAWQWFGTVDATYTQSGGSDDVLATSSVGGDRDFLLGNGIQVGAGLAIDWARYLTGDPQTSLGSVLTGTITAPILGAGAGKAAQENLTQAERNMLYRIRTFNRYRQTFVTSIIDDYYSVLQQRDRMMVTEASYQRQIDSTNRLRMTAEVGQLPQADADEAEQRLLSVRNNLISTQQSYAQTLDRFKVTLGLSTETDIVLDQNELEALTSIGVSSVDYTEEDAIAIALERRLDLANTRDGLIDVERKLILAAEGLGPQVNLTAGANVDSTPETDFTRLRFHDGTYSLGISADLPFDRKSERNAYREALINVQQRQRSYDQEVENIKLSVRQAYRDLTESAETYQIQQMGLRLAQRRVDEQKIRLDTGSGTVRQLLESEDSLLEARISLADALVRHTIAKLNFFSDIGVLQVKPDGMWEQATL